MELPYLDEHATVIAAGADQVWTALVETIDRMLSRPSAARYARAVRAENHAPSGPRPLAEGSVVPGFKVTSAAPGFELVLRGRHYFSSYALIFRIDQLGADQTRLRAESRAAFPGLAGRAYRLIVVGTGGHVVAVRRMLAAVRHHAEQH